MSDLEKEDTIPTPTPAPADEVISELGEDLYKTSPYERVIDDEAIVRKEPVADSSVAEPAIDAAAKTPAAEEPGELAEPYQDPPARATLTYETSHARTRGSVHHVDIPAKRREGIEQQINRIPNTENGSSKYSEWARHLVNIGGVLPMADFYNRRVDESDAAFGQAVEHQGRKLTGVLLRAKPDVGVTEIDGEKAAIQLATHMGIGGLPRIPLWKSGFWVTFKPAMDIEFVDLWYSIMQDEVTLGRWSYGLALSGTVSYTLDRVLEFAIRHIYSTSVKAEELPLEKLRDYLMPQDINAFLQGFLAACYPSGHYYSTSCVNNPMKCTHVFEATLNVAKLAWTDTSKLTDSEKAFMANSSPNIRTLNDIKAYQDRMRQRDEKRVVLFERTDHEVAVTLHTPTTTQYLDESFRWIDSIVQSVTRALGQSGDLTKRQNYVKEKADSSELMQYVHWVKSIEFGTLTPKEDSLEGTATNVISDRNSIAQSLAMVNPAPAVRELIMEKIRHHIEDTTLTVIAVPSYTCPVCQTPQEAPLEAALGRKVSLIPLDLLQLFIRLLIQRLSKAEAQ